MFVAYRLATAPNVCAEASPITKDSPITAIRKDNTEGDMTNFAERGALPKDMFADLVGNGIATADYRKGVSLFTQGEMADFVIYIQSGLVKVTAISAQGKEAIVTILSGGDYVGEKCLIGLEMRATSAVAMTDVGAFRIEKTAMTRLLHENSMISGSFVRYLLARNVSLESDLVDQLINTSEKRLARLLLKLAKFGEPGRPEPVLPPISQETLAEMVGTTRARVSHFMNKFRQLGYIEYNGILRVHSSLSNVLANDPIESS
jgi:CRP/FNR family transcriptional regulator, cyclic AMP receptor protein